MLKRACIIATHEEGEQGVVHETLITTSVRAKIDRVQEVKIVV